MSFTVRHKWVAQQIAECFSLSTNVVERFLKRTDSMQILDKFFKGIYGRCLFCYYQTSDASDPGDPPELHLTNGTDEKIKKKALYLLRFLPKAESIDVSKAYDPTLVSGHLSGTPLKTLELFLSKVLRESLAAGGQWGKAGNDKGGRFLVDLDIFSGELREALKDVIAGIDLGRIDKKYDPDNGGTIKITDPKLIQHFSTLLTQWCNQIEKYLKEEKEDDSSDNNDIGPRTEHDYWRRRLQRLTSVSEQLRTNMVKLVISTMTQIYQNTPEDSKDSVTYLNLLKRWKQTDSTVTEHVNEAKDNVKYLLTLDKVFDPLYNGSPQQIIESLPGLMNSIKMIHTTARYYNTTERLTRLFTKISNQIILVCENYILGKGTNEDLWTCEPTELIVRMETCIRLNSSYQENYRSTKQKLLTTPKGKQFEFSEITIFGKIDLFSKRLLKLIDMFLTFQQFQSLGHHKLEGMDAIVQQFKQIVGEFQGKRHILLAYTVPQFDRDFVDFNTKITRLEDTLQQFINRSFESVKGILGALNLLRKFQSILQRESLKRDLESKFHIIFLKYGQLVENISILYEKNKESPPIPRNLPPVAGNITWSRHLLKIVEEPMKRFEENRKVLESKEAKKIVKNYNKLTAALISFECIWYKAWTDKIEAAKSGLQATLLVRNVEDGKLYVNFDAEILELIREAKCLSRMNIEIPEAAKIVLLQEGKFKTYYSSLQHILKQYDNSCKLILQITANILKPHMEDMEYKLKPGLTTLTWTSMNIDAYKTTLQNNLDRFEDLIKHINDIVENRIEKNLKIVSRTLLVDIPEDKTYTLDFFVSSQEKKIFEKASFIQSKNIEIERSVSDLISLVTSYQLDPHVQPVKQLNLKELLDYYNNYMYQSILILTNLSLGVIKSRVNPVGTTSLFVSKPIFEVDVQLVIPIVVISPSINDIQRAINKAAQAILKASQLIFCWGQDQVPAESRISFFDRITNDKEIVCAAIALTGSIQGLKNKVNIFLTKFTKYDWLWKEGKEAAYEKFIKKKPTLEDYEYELLQFGLVEEEIKSIPESNTIGVLSLVTKNLKTQLLHENNEWKIQYSGNLHKEAKERMDTLTDYINKTTNKVKKVVDDLDSLRNVLDTLREIREKESGIEMEISPIMDMYQVLEYYLPQGYMDKDEMDNKIVLKSNWKKLVDSAEDVNDQLRGRESDIKRKLLKDIKIFTKDVYDFRKDYEINGPMVPGLKPIEAVDRLRKYKEELDVRNRKYETYHGGEIIFNLRVTEYPELDKTNQEVQNLDKLYSLYMNVIKTITEEWREILWVDVVNNFSEMQRKVELFVKECRRMPKSLRDWDAYNELKQIIDDFDIVLPLLESLSLECIRPRHWGEVMEVCKKQFTLEPTEFRLKHLLDSGIAQHKEDIEEICEGAKKQLTIENKLREINERWKVFNFEFTEWKGRPGVVVLKAVTPVVEELEEAQLNLQTMLTMKHVYPFREEVQTLLATLSDTAETLELWIKVQMLWCSLESVFTGGDIAKQMPLEAKKFGKIDKDFIKLLQKSEETKNVVQCCGNDLLKSMLPTMYSELEKCQKSLEGYLEQKRGKFPRFYFVSNPVLLQILSKGSDPQQIQSYYENLFDCISHVTHATDDQSLIKAVDSRMGDDIENIPLRKFVKCHGNIEDWLMDLLVEQNHTMKDICARTAQQINYVTDISHLRGFVDSSPGQFALLGLQFLWTSDCQEAFTNCKLRKGIVSEKNKKISGVLSELSSWCLQDLKTRMNRYKIETLVTIQVHQKDVMSQMASLFKNKRLSGPNDFEWLKQLRFYWKYDVQDHMGTAGACVISVTDVDFNYQHEYLGVKERLVVTPLTDRCYITLAQAMGMFYGGSPAGPAGTGKTETVKDLGRSLGIFVVVTNCSDQMRYNDCGKLFKGICQSGVWGCFDEFNRIMLPVLSVVAQQVQAINNAKKMKSKTLSFPGDPQIIYLNPCCGYFITMNPGYAGRQELPENLKALFRGVTMMVPDKQIIIAVKLCSVGYSKFPLLAKKFYTLYILCEQQLSKQRHYDFGLRNILSVLRTAGSIKRNNLDKPEDDLLFTALRDMNLSKLIAQDVPLFLSLLKDLFPGVNPPGNNSNDQIKIHIKSVVEKRGLIHFDSWVLKVVQLCETTRVRHGIMLVGPSGGGKTTIIDVLRESLSLELGMQHKQVRMNPKAIRPEEMYGETDPATDEWTTGIFSAMWTKCNQRTNRFNTWMIMDGPVDTLWIENLNSVLDDNKMLTLANGDRIPMTDNVKLMFENETLVNASPATVSRAGIIYVSNTDLDWEPIMQAWANTIDPKNQEIIRNLFRQYVGECTPKSPGHVFNWLFDEVHQVFDVPRPSTISGLCKLLEILMEKSLIDDANREIQLTKIFIYCYLWTLGGLLEPDDRVKFCHYILHNTPNKSVLPKISDETTYFEWYVNPATVEWEQWKAPEWEYPDTEVLKFSTLLVPTMDSTRSLFLCSNLIEGKYPVLMIGGPGTAKTSISLMYFESVDKQVVLFKHINFSFATSPGMFQSSIESDLEKRGGKNFGPPNGKKLCIFIDDLSQPEVNMWGDQPTNEIVRQLISEGGFCFLDKDKRGDFKVCEDLLYLSAMQHPSGGRNNIPNRLKRSFFIFNLVLPSLISINDIYGQMLEGRFQDGSFSKDCLSVVDKLTTATIKLWTAVKKKMLPTPSKFHYNFDMRELSRVFQGILLTTKEVLKEGGICIKDKDAAFNVLHLWCHECDRVFSDKLTNNEDKNWYTTCREKICKEVFNDELVHRIPSIPMNYVCFMRDPIIDPETDEIIEAAPLIYERGGDLENVRNRSYHFLKAYNEEHPSVSMNLVFFDHALHHLMRLVRVLNTPRGSCLLVGVGGSGKQSLARMASHMLRQTTVQITLTKNYGVSSFMEDLKVLYKIAGGERKNVTFIFTDSEIKQESFLEYINSILMTGEVSGLLAKDEIMGMCSELGAVAAKENPDFVPSTDNLKRLLINTVRDNLHLVLCMSPMNAKFSERATKFPAIISGCNIDWFLPWPREALISVSKGLLSNFNVECTSDVKEQLMEHVGTVHSTVVESCDDYFNKMRRKVYQTPKSYLSFLNDYKKMYTSKLNELNSLENKVNTGLNKLEDGAKQVEVLKGQLATEQIKLDKATQETNKMLDSLQISSQDAKREGDQVAQIAKQCEADAERIAKEKTLCQADLDKAQPFVDQANDAINSILPAHISEIKKLTKPSDIIRIVFDGCLILFQQSVDPVIPQTLTIAKKEVPFLTPSWNSALVLMNNANFLKNLMTFGQIDKDKINEETVELLEPYLDLENFNPQTAKTASAAAEGLCTWVQAMKSYHVASKVVKPKLEALRVSESELEQANKRLAEVRRKYDECQKKLDDLQAQLQDKLSEKKKIEDGAMKMQRTMDRANNLLTALAGEKDRWENDRESFANRKHLLVGDVAVSCAFVSYCGAFNQSYRSYLINSKFIKDCQQRRIPVSTNLDISDFLVNIATIGEWNMQGLPSDPLSIQNGLLVTRSNRYPLLIDPQGQAIAWLKRKEVENLPPQGETTVIDHPKFKEYLEFCMSEGKSFLVSNVLEELDPVIDPLLEKQIIKRGKSSYIRISDKECELNEEKFRLYFITRLPNPHFTPELQAKTVLIDFTVTQKGLEDQLLGRVLKHEQRQLEEQLNQVLADVNNNTKALFELDDQLLTRLSSDQGNLLEDEQLIIVLTDTKTKAFEVQERLKEADVTRKTINDKREQYRPVATRGSCLYFSIVDVTVVNCMYQTSLAQFLEVFMNSMAQSEKAVIITKRVSNIIETMTYLVYRYVNRGLYEIDKLPFLFIMTTKILLTADLLKSTDIPLFLRGGAALDIGSVKQKPFKWISNEAWLNVIQLSLSHTLFKQLPEDIARNEAPWKLWYENNEPESVGIPDYEPRISDNKEIGPYLRLLLVRSLRVDRTMLTMKMFIKNTPQVGEKFVEPVTDTLESILAEMIATKPTVFLLSPGADPTEAIEALARKNKRLIQCVSMGDGQGPVAWKALNTAQQNGSWVLLQNCELGLDVMVKLEDYIYDSRETVNPDFRLFITALPDKDFPLGLLQMSIKVTNEPPAGLKPGLLKSYTVIVDQERLDVFPPSHDWRKMLFILCFLHSIVQERRKFGALGWSIPYEYNNGDLIASITFLEKHLLDNRECSWDTTQYMISEVQYGGKITDNLDRRLFNAYARKWLCKDSLIPGFNFNPDVAISKIPDDFVYTIRDELEIDDIRKNISIYPDIDTPEIFGLHPNADLTYRVKEANSALDTLSNTQPKESSSGDNKGKTREDIVVEKLDELLEKMPQPYIEDKYVAIIRDKLGGMGQPLNIFLFQELQRMEKVIDFVRKGCKNIKQAINGEVVMSIEIQKSMYSISDARVPVNWVYKVTGDEFSWISPTLGLWFNSLLLRHEQYFNWLERGRLPAFWLTGFFNPQGFLTAMQQEVTRNHRNEKWALDDVIYTTEVTQITNKDNIKQPPNEGVYVYGLYLEGCGFNVSEKSLVESTPKILFANVPVLLISAISKNVSRQLPKNVRYYQCPLYKYPARTDRYFITILSLPYNVNENNTRDMGNYWILRGVALLCATE